MPFRTLKFTVHFEKDAEKVDPHRSGAHTHGVKLTMPESSIVPAMVIHARP
jgi:hypothetical protein